MTEMIWYEYEAAEAGKNDWHSTNLTANTREDLAKISLLRTPYNNRSFDLRIVRKTLTTVVLVGIE